MPNLYELIRQQWSPSPESIARMRKIAATVTPESEVLSGDPGTSPITAMIPTVKNLDKFRKLILSWMKKAPKDLPEEAKQAWAYMQARHPFLTKKGPVVEWWAGRGGAEHSPRFALNKQGVLDEASKYTRSDIGIGLPQTGERRPGEVLSEAIHTINRRLDDLETPEMTSDVIRKYGHELGHLIDTARRAKTFGKHKALMKDYPYGLARLTDPLDEEAQFLKLWTHPSEVFARKAGTSFLNEFDRFLDLLGQ